MTALSAARIVGRCIPVICAVVGRCGTEKTICVRPIKVRDPPWILPGTPIASWRTWLRESFVVLSDVLVHVVVEYRGNAFVHEYIPQQSRIRLSLVYATLVPGTCSRFIVQVQSGILFHKHLSVLVRTFVLPGPRRSWVRSTKNRKPDAIP